MRDKVLRKLRMTGGKRKLSRVISLKLHQLLVGLRATVAEELPSGAHLVDHIKVELGYQQFVFVFGSLCENLAAWVHEVAGTVELT